MAKKARIVNKCTTTTLLDMEFSQMTPITRKVCRDFVSENLGYLKKKEEPTMEEISYLARLNRKLKGLNEYEKNLRK